MAHLDGDASSEIVSTVSEDNVPTQNGIPRSEVRRLNLWHRATYIVVLHDASSSKEPKRVLVQRRSSTKDYCPSRLDPAPGGVVQFGESYEENAQRELMEEMGIDTSHGNKDLNRMRKLFTFPYEDNRVRCWGGLFEVVSRLPLHQLKLQQEEVEEVIPMTLAEIQKQILEAPQQWTPDGAHAIQLYLQRCHDERLRRRLLHGYSSGDLDTYRLRPQPQVIFFDCDDCLYFDGWKVATMLTKKIDDWCVRNGLQEGKAYQLYKQHGTALRGLLAEGHIQKHSTEDIDAYLQEVHDLPIHSLIPRDDALREMIQSIDPSIRKFIFTASVRDHAQRCVEALGIDDLFEGIIDVKACDFHTKHSPEAFQAAMRIADVEHPETCIFLDDSVKNIRAARDVGWRCVLVGLVGRDCGSAISTDHAEHEIARIHEFPHVYPELFVNSSSEEDPFL